MTMPMRALVLPLLLAGAVAAQDETGITVEPLSPDPARDARIQELIDRLREIDKPDEGITCTSGGGVGFDALAKDEEAPPVLRELVRLGPAAIPALLRHIDDKRETKLTFHAKDPAFGGMYARSEIHAVTRTERAVVERILGPAALKDDRDREDDAAFKDRVQDHAVTVGDCCFVILGQIVNRSYEAVRYQPTAITFVSSPTRDNRIAEALRAMWGQGDPRQTLARSLAEDLRPRDCGDAALRLLTYFAEEAAPLVARRIDWIWWGYPLRGDAEARLLRAVVATGHPLVLEKWRNLLDPVSPPGAQLAALAAIPDDPGDAVRERVRAMLAQPSDLDVALACVAALPGENSPTAFAWLEREFGKVETRDAQKTQAILAALAALDEEESLPIFRAHIRKLTDHGWGNALVALGNAPRPKLAAALFRGWLDVAHPVVVAPAPRWVTETTRWCDLAAKVISDARPELRFDLEATLDERDRQIAAIRDALEE